MPRPSARYLSLAQEKKRKDSVFWRQSNEKPSIIPGCPGVLLKLICEPDLQHMYLMPAVLCHILVNLIFMIVIVTISIIITIFICIGVIFNMFGADMHALHGDIVGVPLSCQT